MPAPELTADAEHPGLALSVPDADPMLDGDPLQVYVYPAAQVPPLMSEREAQLAEAIAANTSDSTAAMKELGEANLMLVIDVLQGFRVLPGHHVLDLIVQGNTGLIQATKTFRPGRGYRFSIYASFFIHRALDELLRRRQ